MLIVLTLVLSAFFSGMEIAFVSSNKLHIELEKSKGKKGAKLISKFLENPSKFISAMLIGNNISLVVYGLEMAAVLEPQVSAFSSNTVVNLLITTFVSTVVVLVTAEFLPKALFKKHANLLLSALSFPAAFFYYLLSPFVLIFSSISNQILSLFGQKIEAGKVAFTRHDLGMYLSEHTSSLGMDDEVEAEIQILQNALAFPKVKARECMVPRTEIVAIEVNQSVESLHSIFNQSGLSKLIVYDKDIDHIIGFVHCLELFNEPKTIRSMVLKAAAVPEAMLASDVLQILTSQNKSVAIVYDEFGGTSGMICLEDVIEEIFGEIEDEHDVQEYIEEQVNDNTFKFSARLEIDELNQKYKLDLPESDEYETLGGLIFHHLEAIPEVNQKIDIQGYYIEILEVQSTKVELVLLSDRTA
ncbi:MAG: hemolysin family protein [Flavobacteriales bacterium]